MIDFNKKIIFFLLNTIVNKIYSINIAKNLVKLMNNNDNLILNRCKLDSWILELI